MKVTYLHNDTIQVFRKGKTTNAKIADSKEKMVQSYTFSIDQFNYVKQMDSKGVKPSLLDFFSLDQKNCMDCPFSRNNNGSGGCYTHKFMQYSGFIGMIRSLIKEFNHIDNIPTYSNDIFNQITDMSKGLYVRFGSYGEPSMHPFELIETLASNSKSYTGYTHQWFRKPELSKYLMASVHNVLQAKSASKLGYRSFIAGNENTSKAINCPASKEQGFKSNCAKCGLCSGTNGKGKKDVFIKEH